MSTSELETKFDTLFKEGKAAHKKHISNRKGITAKTRNNIMNVKHQVNRALDKIAEGSMRRVALKAYISIDHCSECHREQSRVARMEVWSESTALGSHITRCTTLVLGTGMYEFHQDLPIVVQTTNNYIPRCADCLVADAFGRCPTRVHH